MITITVPSFTTIPLQLSALSASQIDIVLNSDQKVKSDSVQLFDNTMTEAHETNGTSGETTRFQSEAPDGSTGQSSND